MPFGADEVVKKDKYGNGVVGDAAVEALRTDMFYSLPGIWQAKQRLLATDRGAP